MVGCTFTSPQRAPAVTRSPSAGLAKKWRKQGASSCNLRKRRYRHDWGCHCDGMGFLVWRVGGESLSLRAQATRIATIKTRTPNRGQHYPESTDALKLAWWDQFGNSSKPVIYFELYLTLPRQQASPRQPTGTPAV